MQGLFLTSASRLGLFYDNEPLAVYYILTFVWVCVTKHTPLFWKEKRKMKQQQRWWRRDYKLFRRDSEKTSELKKKRRTDVAGHGGHRWAEWAIFLSGCLPRFIYSGSILLSFIKWARAARDDGLAQPAAWQMLDSDWQLGRSSDVHADRTLASVRESGIQSRATEAEITRSVRTAIAFHSSSEDRPGHTHT